MTVMTLLQELHRQGIVLAVEGDKLTYRAPSGVVTSEVRAQLATHKQEILTLLRKRKKSLPAVPPPAPRPERDDADAPLSFGQQRLWFLDQLQPGSASYTMPAALALHGPLDHAALAHSLTAVVARHAVLRTTFAEVGTDVVQRIHPPAPVPLPLVDLRALPPAARAAEAQQRAHAQAAQPFDLRRGPLLRATLLSLEPQTHHLLLTLHHSVADGWSLDVLLRDLRAAYTAACEGQPLALPPLLVQYADYAVWQRTVLQGELLDGQRRYWRTQLTGAPALLELPTDFPRPPVQSFQGADYDFTIPAELTAELSALAQREGATLFMVLLAAFQTLLARYTRQDDIVVGSPIANRSHVELEPLIGLFANTLVLRGDLSGNPSFRALLGRVRETTLQAYAHQDVPFEMLVEEINPQRSLSHSPLFQVMFILQNTPGEPVWLADVQAQPLAMESTIAKFDLTLTLAEGAAGLGAGFEYNTDLFERTTIERLAEHFQTLLRGIVADPAQPIAALPILSERERQQILVGWNATQQPYPRQLCVQQLFEAQARRTPDATAVIYGDQQLSYRQLNERANHIAARLQRQGVGPDVLVGVCLERSLELIVGLLGILKAGGAYVPLDPHYPQERLQFLLTDARPAVVMTQPSLLAGLPDSTAQLMCIDPSQPPGASSLNPSSSVDAENLAYVLYTSGSTGQPKGVQIPHGALVNFLHTMRQQPGMMPQDVLLAVTTISFDIAGLELFLPLITGARVVIVGHEAAADGTQLLALLNSSAATVMQATPATWRLLLAAGWSCATPLRILCGGEALPQKLAARLTTHGELWNLYGPTETTIWSSVARVSSGDQPVRIGQPIANTQLYVLDAFLQPVPIGVAGDLYIGGDGLARGYRNRPALTAEKFIPDPFSAVTGARMYRTGDVVRYHRSGSIEYLSRADDQVKLRGFRIELGEIEAALVRHPQVRQAVAMAREDLADEKQLVAYVVTEDDSQSAEGSSARCSPAELREFLQQHLPMYMLPSAFVMLDGLPLTPNGKVNRRALPAPDRTAALESAYVAPRTPVEEMLCDLWATLLNVERVGVYDDFFALGGHSLLATQALVRVQHSFSISVPLRVLFEQRHIAGIAAYLAAHADQAAPAAPIIPLAPGCDSVLSYTETRLWLFHQRYGNSGVYNVPLTLHIRGMVDLAALEQSVAAVVARHAVLRTTFAAVDGELVRRTRAAQDIPLRVIDVRGQTRAAQQAVVQAEAQEPFDLLHGPLLRAVVLCLAAEEYQLLLTLHHIIIDGWSLDVLLRDLSAAYAAACAGHAATLPPLPVQYADYAAWQRALVQGPLLEAQREYWQRQLQDAPALVDRLADRPAPATRTFQGARQPLLVSPALTTALKALSQREGVTLFMTLLSAFKVVLASYSDSSDIVVSSPIAHRRRAEIEGLIGFFANMLVLRTNLDTVTFQLLLARVRDVTLQGYTNQDLPFDVVAGLHSAQPTPDHLWLQVQFVLQNTPMSSVDVPGMVGQPSAIELTLTPYTLVMVLVETAQGLAGHVEYATERFEAATITHLIADVELLLEHVVADPTRSIAELQALLVERRTQRAALARERG